MQWSLIVAMTIGAGSASTAGGLKVTSIAEIFRGAWRTLHGLPVTRSFGIALTWLGICFGLIFVCLVILLCTDPQIPSDRMFFETVSAVGNVGLSYDPVSMVGPGLYVMTVAMFLGRMLPLLILWWQADTTQDADLAIG
jgi:trk system potassium uptake protein TrkH